MAAFIEQTFSVEEREVAVRLLVCSRDPPIELVFKGGFDDRI